MCAVAWGPCCACKDTCEERTVAHEYDGKHMHTHTHNSSARLYAHAPAGCRVADETSMCVVTRT